MKKVLLLFLFIFLLVSPLLSAIEFNMAESFGREGILTAHLKGQFIDPPLKENIALYRGHVRVAVDPYVARIEDDYYIYAPLAGKEPRNYSLVIEDISYMKGSKKITEDLSKNFTISENYSSFIVSPGFVSTKDDFKLTIENLLDETIDVTMVITTFSGTEGGILSYYEDTENEISVKPGSQDISFELDTLSGPTSKTITFSYDNLNYTIPISLYLDEQSEQAKTFDFNIEPEELEITMPTYSNLSRLIYIYSTGTGTLTDVQVNADSLKPFASLSEDRFSQVLPNSNANFKLNLVSGAEQSISGKLEVRTDEGVYKQIKVSLKFKEGYEMSPEESGEEVTTEENCASSNIGGKICEEDEKCAGQEIYAKDGKCCIGGVCRKQATGSTWKWIGWGMLVILIVAGVWFYFKRYKGVKKPVDLLKFTRKK